MKRTLVLVLWVAGLGLPTSPAAAGPPKFEFKDGDRVVLIGDSLIENDQKYGYLETLLTLLNPDKTITFRNLGWSGDTVHGHARAGFGPQPDGFKHLREHVLALKPTVLIVGYGMTESFDGEAGLSRFVSGLNALLDALAPTGARLIFFSPIVHLDLGPPLPDAAGHNQSLALYSGAIRRVAEERHGTSVDLFRRTSQWAENPAFRAEPKLYSADGIHLTAFGYRSLAVDVLRELGWLDVPWNLDLAIGEGKQAKQPEHSRSRISELERSDRHVRFLARDANLPVPDYPEPAPRPFRWLVSAGRSLAVRGLPGESYTLKIDDTDVASASGSDWARGVKLRRDPAVAQVETLRKTINEKNLLYFYRWRPQNETYLFGFRKHEQGNNAREIPLFDPLVDAKEQEIARLRVPATHVYELTRGSEESK